MMYPDSDRSSVFAFAFCILSLWALTLGTVCTVGAFIILDRTIQTTLVQPPQVVIDAPPASAKTETVERPDLPQPSLEPPSFEIPPGVSPQDWADRESERISVQMELHRQHATAKKELRAMQVQAARERQLRKERITHDALTHKTTMEGIMRGGDTANGRVKKYTTGVRPRHYGPPPKTP